MKWFKREIWMHQKLHLTRTHYKYGCTRNCTLQEHIINGMHQKLYLEVVKF